MTTGYFLSIGVVTAVRKWHAIEWTSGRENKEDASHSIAGVPLWCLETQDGAGFSRAQVLASLSVSECDAKAGREDEFVLFFSYRRVGDVGVANCFAIRAICRSS